MTTNDLVTMTPAALAERTQAEQDAKKLLAPFTKELAELDKEPGRFKLTPIWQAALRIHDENSLLRANVAQMQVVLQDAATEWTKSRKRIGERLDNLKSSDKNYIEEEEALQRISANYSQNLAKINRGIRDLRKEIRQTEFASRYLVHLNTVQIFLMGLHATLMTHLQGDPRKDIIIAQLQRLVGAYGLDSQRKLVEKEMVDG